jgi:hypothetical protein
MVGKLTDIREQFPLLPREDTLALAAAMGVKHPPGLITVDFMLTFICENETVYVARDVKQLKALTNTRTLQKLSIAHAFLEIRGIDWGLIISDQDLPEDCWRNVEWIHEARNIKNLAPLTASEIRKIAAALSADVVAAADPVTLESVCSACDHRLHLKGAGSSLKVARFLLANKVWRVDMTRRIDTSKPILIQIDNLGSFLEEICPQRRSA